jgi:hypothetical protein
LFACASPSIVRGAEVLAAAVDGVIARDSTPAEKHE